MFFKLILSYIIFVFVTFYITKKLNFRTENSLFFSYTILSVYGIVVYTIYGSFDFEISFKMFWAFLIFLVSQIFVNVHPPFPKHLCTLKIFVVVSVLAPISEELFFRGVLLNIYPNPIINAFVFALMHFSFEFDLESLIYSIFAFIAGLVFSISVLSSGSLFPAILYHSVNNTLSFILWCRGVKIQTRWLRKF